MTVLTDLYRVDAKTINILEEDPELMDRILGHSHDAGAGARLGFPVGETLPRLKIGGAWDEILLLLAGTGSHEAYQALHISVWEAYDGCEEIRIFSADVVSRGLAALDAVKTERLRDEALRRGLRTYHGDPVSCLLAETLGHFERLREFWRAAALAGESIIACTV